jgi:hypothetical protein
MEICQNLEIDFVIITMLSHKYYIETEQLMLVSKMIFAVIFIVRIMYHL